MTKQLTVVYPPLRDPSEVPCLLSSCVSSVRSTGTDVEFIDGNEQFWNYIFNSEHVQTRYEQLESDWDYWQEQVKVPSEKQEYVYGLIKAMLRRKHVEEKINESVSAMKHSNDIVVREKARTIIRYALEAFQLPYLPTQLTINDANLIFSTESTEQIIESIEHESNPFYAYLENIVGEVNRNWVIWVEADQQLIPTFTLTHLIQRKFPKANIQWMGPFFADFGKLLIDSPPMGIDEVRAITVPHDFLEAILPSTNNTQLTWSTECLNVKEYWSPYTDIQVRKEWMKDPDFFSWLSKGDQNVKKRLYLYQPTTIEEAIDFSERILHYNINLSWGIYLKFNQALSHKEAETLKSRGLDWIHWELKGWQANEPFNNAKYKLKETWHVCKKMGINLYHSIVMGYPLTSPESFADFVKFLDENTDSVERLIRFKLFRLYKNSSFWNEAKHYGIEWISEQTPGKDLQRGFHFKTKTGWNSETFNMTAASYIKLLQQPLRRDFPRDVLAVDDTKLSMPQTQSSKTTREIGIEEKSIVISNNIVISQLPFSPAEFEKSALPTVPGRIKEYTTEDVQQKNTYVLYDLAKDSFIIINPTIAAVLKKCHKPIITQEIINKFPEKQQASVRQLFQKFYLGGILVEGT